MNYLGHVIQYCSECIGEECNYYSSSNENVGHRVSGRYLLGSARCSSSSDSSSFDAYYSCSGYYNDKCNDDSSSSNGAKYKMSSSSSDRRRRRILLGASFGSMRHLSSSSSEDYYNGIKPKCIEIKGIFLPLWENECTDFNSSKLNITDINGTNIPCFS